MLSFRHSQHNKLFMGFYVFYWYQVFKIWYIFNTACPNLDTKFSSKIFDLYLEFINFAGGERVTPLNVNLLFQTSFKFLQQLNRVLFFNLN